MSRRLLANLSQIVPAITLIVGVLLVPLATAQPADDVAMDGLPPNLDKGLRQLIVWHRAQPHNLSATDRRARLAKASQGRHSRLQVNTDATVAVVDVTLDGSVPLATVRAAVTGLGVEVLAEYDAGRAGSILSANMPLDLAEATVRVPGVYSISLVHRPWRHAGYITSQGLGALHVDQVNKMGFDGTGITIGVISDSFATGYSETSYKPATTAATDVTHGDLPGPGNPLGHTDPVKVVVDGPLYSGDIDEGRAMAQIIHDLAPGARLMFHTAGKSPAGLAEAIYRLCKETDPACDVIVDDYGFPGEPFFSDGPAALAARDAATKLLQPGHPVVYVSSAGNDGDSAYAADFALVTATQARVGVVTDNLKLDQVPPDLFAGGLHNFNPKPGKVTLAQKVKLAGESEVSFQWDDPFIPGKVTSDYNLLVFDSDGNYLPDLSGTDDNLQLGRAVEIVDLPLGEGDSMTYQFAIARRAAGTGEARHLRYVMNGGGPVIKSSGYNHQTTFGHNAGAGVIGVAAYAYDKLSETEAYSSLGPSTIYFDTSGERLATPEVRQQPAVAAVDGVDTTFFPPGSLKLSDGSPGTDTDGDGRPNFFGTSAAAPHVAAVAALLLQAAGGPGSLTTAQVLDLLQSTAAPHDLDPNFASATLAPGDDTTVTLSATADESNGASADKNGFHLAFDGPADRSLRKVVIDLSATPLKFDLRSDLGYPFTFGAKAGLSAADVTATVNESETALTLLFAPETFVTGRSLNFGIDRDLLSSASDGNSADLLAGAVVKVHTKGTAGGAKARGTLANQVGTGYSPAAGFGLVDAKAAVKSLLAHPPVAAAKLVPGDILLTTSGNRIVEVTREGTVVQALDVPTPRGPDTRELYKTTQETLVDANGNLVVLTGLHITCLLTINTKTGAVTTATAPDWSLLRNSNTYRPLAGEIVTTGRYVFANYCQEDYTNPHGLLLRFNIDTGAFDAFGVHDRGSNKTYTSLSIGPDGLLYAMCGYPLVYGAPGLPMDVYDPNTLKLVRTVYLNLGDPGHPDLAVGRIAVGPAGEIYALPNDSSQANIIYKLDANGRKLASLALPAYAQGYIVRNNLRVDAQGSIVVGTAYPLLIDPSFRTVTRLDIFGASSPASTQMQVAATFIGP